MRLRLDNSCYQLLRDISRRFLITTMIVIAHSLSASEEKLSLVTEFLPPYQFTDADGNLTGYSIEVVEALMDEVHIDGKIKLYPWARAFKLAKDRKNTLIFSIARTPEREAHFHWLGKLHNESYTFLALKNNPHIKADNLETLKSFSVAVSRSSVVDQTLTNLSFPKIERTADLTQSLKMLFHNRVDMIIVSEFALSHHYPRSNFDLSQFRQVFMLKGHSSDLYIAANLNSNPESLSRLKRAFKWLETSGRLATLKHKWHMSSSQR